MPFTRLTLGLAPNESYNLEDEMGAKKKCLIKCSFNFPVIYINGQMIQLSVDHKTQLSKFNIIILKNVLFVVVFQYFRQFWQYTFCLLYSNTSGYVPSDFKFYK